MKSLIKKINKKLSFSRTSPLSPIISNIKNTLKNTKNFSYNNKTHNINKKNRKEITKILDSKFYMKQLEYFIYEDKTAKKLNLSEDFIIKLVYAYIGSVIYQRSKNYNNESYLYMLCMSTNNNSNSVADKEIHKHISSLEQLDKDYVNHINDFFSIFNLVKDNNLNHIYKLSWLYNILKVQQSLLFSKKSNNSIINIEKYNSWSDMMMIIINQVKALSYQNYGDKDKELISRLSDLDIKLWLKDDSKLTLTGKFNLGFSYIFLATWGLIILYPIYLLIKSAFNSNAKTSIEGFGQYKFTTSNFSKLFSETLFTTWLWNTIQVALITMIIVVSFTALMAYAYSRYKFTGKKSTLITVMILQMFPTIAALPVFVIYYAILKQSAGFSPKYVLVLIYSGGAIFGNTFVIKGFMDGISKEIDDAARIDGCSSLKTFRKIILPLCKPILAVVSLWSFIGPFGDYILPQLLIQETKQQTIAAGIRTLIAPQGQDTSKVDYGTFTAGSLLISVPIVILFLYLQRFIRSGATDGGVK